ncbi:unnamed protein product [Phytophthora fragariaefolia]|uniref:Unnamed protein product n=1 Tax=Phytophthora fragariaefolia TaxID=1490495 RepID=A0A9W6TPI1_9STRA|nr:unnamed protein product [Phytophthora fragariaefolia]
MLIAQTPDVSFLNQITGILDERLRSTSSRPKLREASDEVVLTRQPESGRQLPLQVLVDPLVTDVMQKHKKSRKKYYDVVSRGMLLRLQTAYNAGSLAGVIEACVKCVESTVLLIRSADLVSSDEEAFSPVAMRLKDVFATMDMECISNFLT